MMEDAAPWDDLPKASMETTDLATLELLDPGGVDWPRVERTAYLVHQHLRYEYPGPIEDLTQRLMLFPPPRHGDQWRVMYRLEVAPASAARVEEIDPFGNPLITLHIPAVERAVDFEAWLVVERRAALGPLRLPGASLTDPVWRAPTPLTAADGALRAAAARLGGGDERALAERIAAWSARVLRYEHGVTSIHTSAAEALALRRGVCQDYAHVMLAVCRAAGLAARYVSGHLLGEGGSHAWVEVILPDAEYPGSAVAWPYDPANGCAVDLRYVTVAVGRDYHDVAPTSGTFRAAYPGALHAKKSVALTTAEYAPAGG